MATARRGNATRQITPRQLEILTRIRDHQRSHGYSPTMQELADALGISKVTVFEHVDTLVRKGLLRRSAHRARSLEVTGAAQFPDERPTLLPLVGRIAAGLPLEAVENPETLDLEEVFASNADTFVLRVRGDSMIDEQIRDGDTVVVEARETARNGETVIALVDGDSVTVKQYYREGARIRLQPANPAVPVIIVPEEKVRIQGVVIGVLRRFH